MILLLDNYDSFVYNLDRYLQQLGQATLVVRSDSMSVDGIAKLAPDAIVISPGPCTPNEAGCSLEVVRRLGPTIPMLGVCLGHQTIGQAFGGRVVRASQPIHGKSSSIQHRGQGLFHKVPSPCTVGRYHSLILERSTLPESLRVTAWTDDGTIMGIEHSSFPVHGVQFHPESILTEVGYLLLANFLTLYGNAVKYFPLGNRRFPPI